MYNLIIINNFKKLMNQKLNNLIDNKIFVKQKYSLILGLSPSNGARSPSLWNKVYKK